ncbi:hypothetical protein [Hydrogenophaga sp.]|uniref:DUF6891 domain-containing protein n=1 Tax=Hydrogenophaga sp. TaxID=1904254 RepID=UPI0027322AC8|nr:hypothetical protein [Hydrogenophaga sp.]MDP1684142.1 hypothetical protein [Hydrogenophaga sp.]
MKKHQHPTRNSPIFHALDMAVDSTTDDATEDMLEEVVSAVWYGFDSPEKIDALIAESAGRGDPFDVDKVRTTAANEFAKKRIAEAGWPKTTDCDLLDRAFARLHEQGICALHCVGKTQQDGLESVSRVLNDDDHSEIDYHGYCFYYSQDVDQALDGGALLLAHGHVDRSEAPDEEHVAVAQAICDALRHEGLEVAWRGSKKHRIELPRLTWQRRSPN